MKLTVGEAIFEALEDYGDREGTEAQLNQTNALLMAALDELGPPAAAAFMARADVKEILETL